MARPRGEPVDGAELRRLMSEQDWTQEDLAAEAGVSPRSVQRAVAGEPLDRATLRALGLKLKVDWPRLVRRDLQPVTGKRVIELARTRAVRPTEYPFDPPPGSAALVEEFHAVLRGLAFWAPDYPDPDEGEYLAAAERVGEVLRKLDALGVRLVAETDMPTTITYRDGTQAEIDAVRFVFVAAGPAPQSGG